MKDKEEILQDYERDYRRAWCTTIQIVLQLLILFFVFLMFISTLSGCVHVTLPDGTEYWRLGEQQIGEVLFTLPDGTKFLMEQQKSTIPVLIVTPAGWQLGEARKVGP